MELDDRSAQQLIEAARALGETMEELARIAQHIVEAVTTMLDEFARMVAAAVDTIFRLPLRQRLAACPDLSPDAAWWLGGALPLDLVVRIGVGWPPGGVA